MHDRRKISIDIKFLANDDNNINEIRCLVEQTVCALTSAGWEKVTIAKEFLDALHTACRRGQVAIVRYFLEEQGLLGEWRDKYSDTALHNACSNCVRETHHHPSGQKKKSCLDVVKYLVEVEQSDIHARNRTRMTPLHFAAQAHAFDIVEYLVLERRADVDALDDRGEPPLLYSYSLGRYHHDLSRFLIPRTTLTPRIFKRAWLLEVPIDVKQQFVEKYYYDNHHQVQQEDNPKSDYCSLFPLHAAFYAPLPSEDAVWEFVNLYGIASLSQLDSDGRLPIHIAAMMSTMRKSSADAFSLFVMIRLVELEPNSSLVRDPTTGLYPFEIAATIMSNAPRWRNDRKEHGINLLTLVYKMFHCNPARLLQSRCGGGGGGRGGVGLGGVGLGGVGLGGDCQDNAD